jgi:hypothetical protein
MPSSVQPSSVQSQSSPAVLPTAFQNYDQVNQLCWEQQTEQNCKAPCTWKFKKGDQKPCKLYNIREIQRLNSPTLDVLYSQAVASGYFTSTASAQPPAATAPVATPVTAAQQSSSPDVRRSTRETKGKPPQRYGANGGATSKQRAVQAKYEDKFAALRHRVLSGGMSAEKHAKKFNKLYARYNAAMSKAM